MKSKFPGYFKLNEEEISSLWQNALFTLDTNILLNLYRYSDETREEFFKILNKLKDRIWIPHQSAQEFFNNRLNVISQQEKAYEEAISALSSIEKEFKNTRQHPFISLKLLRRFSSLNKDITEHLIQSKNYHKKQIVDDNILIKIEKLFDSKVGDEFNSEELKTLCKEGEHRFSNKIPPGYKDSSKGDNSESDIRKYGDLIVWKQIINQSKELKQDIILVTDDRKEDWWVRFKGKTVSPRPELVKEFQTDAEQSFHMYQSDRFLEYARDFLNEEVDERAIEEIRELRRLDERLRIIKIRRDEENRKFHEFREAVLKERLSLEEELKFMAERKEQLKELLDQQYLLLETTDPSTFDDRKMKHLRQEMRMLDSKSDEIRHRIMSIKEKEMKERIRRKKTIHDKGYSA